MLDASEQEPRRGALRPGRGAAGDLPDDSGRGARGGLAGGRQAARAAAGHLRRRHQGRGPVPRAGQARGPDPGQRRGAGRRFAHRDQRPARAGDLPGAAPGARRLRARRLPARRGGCRQAPSRADRPAGRALARGLPAPAGRGPGPLGDRHRALPDLPAEVQVRARLRHPAGDRRSTSASGSSSTRCWSDSTDPIDGGPNTAAESRATPAAWSG